MKLFKDSNKSFIYMYPFKANILELDGYNNINYISTFFSSYLKYAK